jgi:hypothetical protein
MKMKEIGFNKVNRFCLKKNHLTQKSRINNILKISNDICGLHATASSTIYLSLFVRTKNFKKEDLNHQLYDLKNLGKVRFVRGTMYVLSKEMIPVAYSATKGIFSSLSEKYAAYHGINKKEFAKISKNILELLRGKSLSVSEIKKALGNNTKISPVINLMCDLGLLIRSTPKAGWKSNLHTYQPMDDYFPGLDLFSIKEDVARRKLVKHYITTFGPVTIGDISWWTGFKKTEIKRILKELNKDISEINILDSTDGYYILKSDEKSLRATKTDGRPIVTLLPTIDPYLMGYKVRNRYLDDRYHDYIFDRSGNGAASIMVDGYIIGAWDLQEKPKALVKIYLFKKIIKEVKSEIKFKAENIGKFMVDGDVKIKECRKMKPLPQRTAGSVMSPLKGC